LPPILPCRPADRRLMRSKLAWSVASMALALVAAVAIVIGRFWNTIGAAEISAGGWLAMGFGVITTLALGIGLMALMFFSSRHGYDDTAQGEYENGPPVSTDRGGDSEAARAEPRRRDLKIGK
jgi:hypothetical protein